MITRRSIFSGLLAAPLAKLFKGDNPKGLRPEVSVVDDTESKGETTWEVKNKIRFITDPACPRGTIYGIPTKTYLNRRPMDLDMMCGSFKVKLSDIMESKC